MNPDKFTPKNETGDLLLSFTENCARLIEQTQIKPQETLEVTLRQRLEKFSITPPPNLSTPYNGKSKWMIGLTGLEK